MYKTEGKRTEEDATYCDEIWTYYYSFFYR